MKKLLVVLLMLPVLSAIGQSDKFVQAMQKNLQLLDSAKTAQDLESVAASFERIAEAEKTEWLPYYYAAFAHIQKAFRSGNAPSNDETADRAEALVARAEALARENAELFCLRSMCVSVKLMVDPQNRGATYGPKAGEYLQKAMALDPKNPRPYLLMGQSTLYTPEFWGGGKAKAKPFLEKAVELFKTEQPAALHPRWGRTMAERLLAQAGS